MNVFFTIDYVIFLKLAEVVGIGQGGGGGGLFGV